MLRLPSKRDAALIAITATVTATICLLIAAPLTNGARGRAERAITVGPGNVVTFARLDWSCLYPRTWIGNGAGSDAETFFGAQGLGLLCTRDSTGSGLSMYFSGEKILVYQCLPSGRCPTLLRHARNP